MSNNNMINPANYYNPFAKYNYVSKTRGVYFPKDTQFVKTASPSEVSGNIHSENYDAETDIMQSIKNNDGDGGLNDTLLGFLNKFFPENE